MNVQNRLSSFPYLSIVLCAILPKTRTLVHATDPTTKTIPIHTKNITENKAHVNMNCGIIFFRYREIDVDTTALLLLNINYLLS